MLHQLLDGHVIEFGLQFGERARQISRGMLRPFAMNDPPFQLQLRCPVDVKRSVADLAH